MCLNPSRSIRAKSLLSMSFLLLLISAGTFLPTAIAHIKVGSSGLQKPAPSENPESDWHQASASDTVLNSPASPAAVSLIVNDTGGAADNNLFDGICDTSPAPGDQCTLPAAISEANFSSGNDTITFSLPPGSTITLNNVLPEISGNLAIIGPGSGSLTIMRSTAVGTSDFRIFTAISANTNISGLTITNGRTLSGTGGDSVPGGGILQAGGSMALTDVVITGNSTGNGGDSTGSGSFRGGFGGNGGGINSSGTLTMTDCLVSNNTTGNGGPNTTTSSTQGGWGGFGGGIMASGTLTMTDCLVSNNSTGKGGTGGGSGGSGGRGGGIHIAPGTLTLQNVTITGNHTGDSGGPSDGNSGYGGGIFSDGSGTLLSMTNVTISNNTTGNTNSRGDVGGGAGIYLLGGSASLISSKVSNNHNGNAAISSGVFGGGGFGGGIFNNGTFTVTNSLISGNSTGDGNLGSSNAGGGIANNFILTLINTTVSGNSAGAGANRGGGIYNGGTLQLTNCTVTGNMANNFNIGNGIVGGPSTTVRNSIIAGNGPGGNGPDLNPGFGGDAFHSQGHNLIGNGESSTGFTAPGDQVGTETAPLNPLLGPLADNGGTTLTHALLDGSPALDAGDDCVTQSLHCGDANIPQLTSDQRGAGFNRIVDGPDVNTTATVDIGAYERPATFPELADINGNEDTTVSVAFEVLDGGSITSVTATSSNTTLVPNAPANINVTGSGSLRIVTINPVASLSGASNITVTVNRTSGSESRTFALTINSVNDAPSFTKGADHSVNENDGAQAVNNWATNILSGPANESGQILSFQVTGNSNPGLFSVAPAISPSGTLTYTPAAGVSGSASFTVTLMDNGGTNNGGNDTSPPQTFIINVLEGGSLRFNGGFTAFEANPNAVITVIRTGGSAGEARVDFATSDLTAVAGADYTATSGTLIFPNGVTSQTFTISIINDTLFEGSETVHLQLTNAAGSGSVGGPAAESSLSIVDNESAPGLTINDVSVSEGESGTVNAVFTVTLSGASAFSASVNFATADGSANTPTDYLATNGQVVFSPGDLTKTISVTVNGDSVPESNENFFVILSGATGSAFISDSQGIATILSDDAPGGTLAFNVLNDSVNENAGFATVLVNRTGNTSAAVTVDYGTWDNLASSAPCATPSGLAAARCDFTTAEGTLRFAAGDTSKSFLVLVNQDNFVEGLESLTVSLFNATGGAVFGGSSAAGISGSLTIVDDLTEPAANPTDDAENFVRQHYHDFLNREADPDGLAFWTDQIVSCGADAQCTETKRINVSAAFYLSIEFQETGYLVERMYKVAFGNALATSSLGGFHQFPVPIVQLNEFLPDTQEIGRDVVVGRPNWELSLENNKQAFAARFVQRARFTTAFPTTITESQFVDRLNTNAGGVLLPNERIQLINELATGAKTRAQVVRTIAEDSDLAISEKNRAFVLMQYFGYMRRRPNDTPDLDHTGYEFWLNKLNQFGGNFVNAEMVKAFIISGEYRQRFGQ